MKKALQITIAGSLFTIEEDGYDRLKAYLSSIQAYFGKLDDSADIISDIEARIAEQLQEKSGGEVVTLVDVEKVVAVMGTVSEIDSETHTEGQTESKDSTDTGQPRASKKLFKNPDDVVIAGVASGLAAYLNIDTLIVRITFIILFFFTSGGVTALYIILAFFVPKAVTAADKINMLGGPTTLNTFKENVRDHVETIKKSNLRTFLETVIQVIGKIIRVLLKVIVKSIGLVLTIGPIVALSFLVFAVTNLIFNIHSPFIDFPALEVIGMPLYYTAIFLGVIFIAIPLFFICLAGISLMTMKRRIHAGTSISLAAVWIVTAIIIGTLSVRVIPEARQKVLALPEYQISNKSVDLKDFDQLELHGIHQVTLVQSPTFSIEATGRQIDLDRTDFNLDGKKLILSQKAFEKACLFCFVGDNVDVTITMPDISSVDAYDIVHVASDSVKSNEIRLNVRDNARIEIKALSATKSTLTVKDIGRLTLVGTSTDMRLDITDIGRFEGIRFNVKNADITSADISKATVNVSDHLTVTGKDMGRVNYIGTPALTKDLSDNASVQSKEDSDESSD